MNETAEAPGGARIGKIEVLAYTAGQVCEALQISKVTLWRLEKRGLLTSIPHLRHKRYSAATVRQFASGEGPRP
jgi:hypothetical protein